MQKSKNITIFILVVIFIYFLFSQFYLKSFGIVYTYIINPIFFVVLALILKFNVDSPYKTDKHKKTIIFYVITTIIAYGIVFLVSGTFLTYGNNPYSHSIKGVLLNFYSIGLVTICLEYIRYKLINNVFKNDRKLIFILIVVIFILKDLNISSLVSSLNIYFLFKTIFVTIVPSIVKNILFTYTAIYADYWPAIIYSLLYDLMLWIPPVLPNTPWIFTSIIDILFPLVLLLYCMYEVSSRDKLHIYQISKSIRPNGIIPLVVVIVVVIWFALGIFPIKPLGIATGSMKPEISIGDAVIIKKCDFKSIEIGDIIEYQRKTYSVVHRVIDKYQVDGTTFFITKGDNNSNEDFEPVREEKVKGKVIFKIPYIAWPTIWLERLSLRQDDIDIETGN